MAERERFPELVNPTKKQLRRRIYALSSFAEQLELRHTKLLMDIQFLLDEVDGVLGWLDDDGRTAHFYRCKKVERGSQGERQ